MLMTFSNEFNDIAKYEFGVDVKNLSTNKLRAKLEDLVEENQAVINNLIGVKHAQEHLKISKELNNKLYYSKKLYNEFMEEFNK